MSQPTATRPASVASAPRASSAQEHDGARHRQRQAEDEPGADGPTPCQGNRGSERRRRRHLHDGARNRDTPDRDQVAEREMHADAEHEQNDADLGQLSRQVRVGDEAGREWTDGNAGDEIAHDRR